MKDARSILQATIFGWILGMMISAGLTVAVGGMGSTDLIVQSMGMGLTFSIIAAFASLFYVSLHRTKAQQKVEHIKTEPITVGEFSPDDDLCVMNGELYRVHRVFGRDFFELAD